MLSDIFRKQDMGTRTSGNFLTNLSAFDRKTAPTIPSPSCPRQTQSTKSDLADFQTGCQSTGIYHSPSFRNDLATVKSCHLKDQLSKWAYLDEPKNLTSEPRKLQMARSTENPAMEHSSETKLHFMKRTSSKIWKKTKMHFTEDRLLDETKNHMMIKN